ncbi:uncharacterized protein FIESC28_11732 [Fusarium coffeatum]|uniref:THIF-type NAD/FAD binding fold domain-containing protein n=1 Tax=Fusarium coffeatum TaxID=231269 RepID=A0A366QFC1_9HYPO|nr:uncharacterized protein FIESC28_11732 [Fusarium coffeatum]RBR03634.1 hypothetical protein FIESC28_11732 [Fusarium coffeatum]
MEHKDLTALERKVVIVIAGLSDNGLAIIRPLVTRGASVVNGDALGVQGEDEGEYRYVTTDVARWLGLLGLYQEAKPTYDPFDHVFANAGLGVRASYLSTQLNEKCGPAELSSQVVDVNLEDVINTSTIVSHRLRKEAGGGGVVFPGLSTGLQRCRVVDYAAAEHVIHIQRDRLAEIDETVLLVGYGKEVNGKLEPAEDEVLKRLAAAAA